MQPKAKRFMIQNAKKKSLKLFNVGSHRETMKIDEAECNLAKSHIKENLFSSRDNDSPGSLGAGTKLAEG